MDKILPPAAPLTNDPLTWIAMVLVVALIGVLLWQLKAAREERAESAKRQEEALTAFRSELSAQRDHDEAQVTRTHERINALATEVRELATSRGN